MFPKDELQSVQSTTNNMRAEDEHKCDTRQKKTWNAALYL